MLTCVIVLAATLGTFDSEAFWLLSGDVRASESGAKLTLWLILLNFSDAVHSLEKTKAAEFLDFEICADAFHARKINKTNV